MSLCHCVIVAKCRGSLRRESSEVIGTKEGKRLVDWLLCISLLVMNFFDLITMQERYDRHIALSSAAKDTTPIFFAKMRQQGSL